MSERVILIGASSKPNRYAYMATDSLLKHGHELFLFGIKEETVLGLKINTSQQELIPDIDTITLYINPEKQLQWEEFIFKHSPKRVLFNPGTENLAFENKLLQKGIKAERVCTLVLLSTGIY